MEAFIKNNYGFVVLGLAGLLLSVIINLPFGLLIGTIVGAIYDRRPDLLGVSVGKKMEWDAKFAATYDKIFNKTS